MVIDNELNDLKYTYQIIRKLKKKYKGDELFLIIGADNIIKFNEWKNYKYLLKLNLIICKRDNIDETAAKTRLSAQNNEEYSMKYADYMIVNDSLDKAVDEILEKIDNV